MKFLAIWKKEKFNQSTDQSADAPQNAFGLGIEVRGFEDEAERDSFAEKKAVAGIECMVYNRVATLKSETRILRSTD